MKQWFRAALVPTVAMTFLLEVETAHSSSCFAQARVENAWLGRKPADADFTVKFTVGAEDCNGWCEGYVDFIIHYYAPSGRLLRESSLASWAFDTDEQRTDEIVEEVETSICNESNNRCEIADIEINEVSCYD